MLFRFILLFAFLLTLVPMAYCGSDRYSTADGEWQTLIWSDVSHISPPNKTLSCNSNKDIHIIHHITSDCAVTHVSSGGGTLEITGGATLVVFGDLEVSGGAQFYIGPGSAVVVYGDLVVSGGSDLINDGCIHVMGNSETSGGGTAGCGAGTSTSPGIASGDDNCFIFGIDVCANPLPIELISFNAEIVEANVLLTWETASETNNDFFTIHKSYDGVNYEEIKQIDGAGQSSTLNSYQFEDENKRSGTTFYRLSQTDYDGRIESFQVISVHRHDGAAVLMPNPCNNNDVVTLKFPRPIISGLVTIYNSQGLIISSWELLNQNHLEITLSDYRLDSGIYLIHLNIGSRIEIHKLNIK